VPIFFGTTLYKILNVCQNYATLLSKLVLCMLVWNRKVAEKACDYVS
jgi:hypothetical protein